MTAALLASPTVAADMLRTESQCAHGLWKQHVRFCLRCAFGDRCRMADALATEADDADRRAERALAQMRQS